MRYFIFLKLIYILAKLTTINHHDTHNEYMIEPNRTMSPNLTHQLSVLKSVNGGIFHPSP